MRANFLHLRSFYAVASEGSFSRAARRLNISQPTLSKQLKALEERHRIKLIESARAPMTLTSAGSTLFEKARAMFDIADEIDMLLGDDDDVNAGAMLRLGADSPHQAAKFIAALKGEIANLEFRVTIANARQTNDLLLKAQVDVGIVCEPMVESGYTYEPLYVDRLVAILPASWPDQDLCEMPLERLRTEMLLLREGTSHTLTATNQFLAECGIRPAQTMQLHTREMIREGVAQGLGISLMFEKECLSDPRIRVLPLATRSSVVEARGYLAVRTERRRIPLIRKSLALARHMRETNGPAVSSC